MHGNRISTNFLMIDKVAHDSVIASELIGGNEKSFRLPVVRRDMSRDPNSLKPGRVICLTHDAQDANGVDLRGVQVQSIFPNDNTRMMVLREFTYVHVTPTHHDKVGYFNDRDTMSYIEFVDEACQRFSMPLVYSRVGLAPATTTGVERMLQLVEMDQAKDGPGGAFGHSLTHETFFGGGPSMSRFRSHLNRIFYPKRKALEETPLDVATSFRQSSLTVTNGIGPARATLHVPGRTFLPPGAHLKVAPAEGYAPPYFTIANQTVFLGRAPG